MIIPNFMYGQNNNSNHTNGFIQFNKNIEVVNKDYASIRLSVKNKIKNSRNKAYWDISNNENLVFKTKQLNSDIVKTNMVLTPAGQLLLGTTTPDFSAILKLESTNKGVLLPRLSITQINQIDNPATGLMDC